MSFSSADATTAVNLNALPVFPLILLLALLALFGLYLVLH